MLTEKKHTPKKGYMDLPVRLILSEKGASYFSKQNMVLKRMHLSDQTQDFGIVLNEYTPASLQRMIVLGYIYKIEMNVHDAAAKRKQIMDLSKLISYAMLYKQFDAAVLDVVLRSDLIAKWNRVNVRNPIDYKTRINDAYLWKVLRKNKEIVEDIKEEIMVPVRNQVFRDINKRTKEKNMFVFLAEKYLNYLDPLVLFILSAYKGSTSYYDIISMIQTTISAYFNKANISEYLSLMILELSSSLRKLSRTAKPVEAMEDLAVIWTVNKMKSNSQGKRQRLQVTVCNKKAEFQRMKDSINEKSSVNLKARSLKDFYLENVGASDLGLYYLSYLSDECKKVDILFDSFVNQTTTDRDGLVNMVLTF